jgi:hypothetical protein
MSSLEPQGTGAAIPTLGQALCGYTWRRGRLMIFNVLARDQALNLVNSLLQARKKRLKEKTQGIRSHLYLR